MHNPSINDILADLERFPSTQKLQVCHNTLDSPYVAFKAASEVVGQLAKQPIVNTFRRVLLDPVRGIILLMSPSRAHADLAENINNVVRLTAASLAINSKPLGATLWRRQNGPDGTGVEADKCYYLGENAILYLQAQTDEEKQVFCDAHAPDLVIEVTISHFDREKVAAYCEMGVAEYWRVKGEKTGVYGVTFLDLLTHDTPRSLATSLGLPGLTPAVLQQCLQVGRQTLPLQYDSVIRSVLTSHRIVHTTINDHDDRGSQAPSLTT